MIEAIKLIGSIVGLMTGTFVVYDRWAKSRPVASFTVIKQGTRELAAIRIINIGDYDIAIQNATVRPSVYFLTEDMEVRSLLEGAEGQEPYFMLKPREEKQLIIVPHYSDGTARDLTQQNVRFRFSWRRCNATWLPQIPVFVWTSTSTIRKYTLERGLT
jgi:hypothetical protein